MNLITITAVDRNSSASTSKTFSCNNLETLKSNIECFEHGLTYYRYELMCNEIMDEYSQDVLDLLNELEITY